MRGSRPSLYLAVMLAGAFSLSALATPDAEAAPRAKPANEGAIKSLMGPFKFGMKRTDVANVIAKQIRERYEEKIAATSDVYRQDKLRRRRNKEIETMQKSFVEFKGKTAGWDVSIIDDQFGHNNNESMMMYWENHDGKDQRRFFFFYNGELYKMFIALNTSQLREDQQNFDFFKEIMNAQYGPSTAWDRGLRWLTPNYKLEAIDKLAFYGTFCLVVTQPKVDKVVVEMRKKNNPEVVKRNHIMESVLEGKDDEGPAIDEQSDAIDVILNQK